MEATLNKNENYTWKFVKKPGNIKEFCHCGKMGTLTELSQKIPGETEIETRKTNHVNSTDPVHSVNNVDEGMTHTKPFIPDVAFHPGPTYRPPPKPIRSNVPRGQESSQSSPSSEYSSSDINLDFEENSPFQEGVRNLSKTRQIVISRTL